MTFKAKSVLQRQCCNAWTEFRGCVLHRDLSHAVSRQKKCSPHISCCTNRIRHLLFSVLLLQVLIEWLRQDCAESLTPSRDYHFYPTTKGINERDLACLHPACMRGGPSSLCLGKLSLFVCCAPLSAHHRLCSLQQLEKI